NLAGNNGDRVLVGNPANLHLQEFTIEAWVKRSSSSVVTNSPGGGSPSGQFFAYGQNGFDFYIDQATGKLGLSQVAQSNVLAPTLTISDTNWHHVAVARSGSQTIFYLDGVADTPVSYAPQFSFSTNASIGSRGDGQTDNAFFGAIDELAIYNRPLSATEIAAIFNAGTVGKCKPLSTFAPDDQVLWLAGDGDTLDSSSSGNNGVSQGSTAFTVGKVGQAFKFDGTAPSQVNISDSQSLRPTTAVTVEGWINPSPSQSGFQGVLFKGNTGSAGGQPYSLFLSGVTHNLVVRVGNDSNFQAFGSVAGIPTDVFSHVAFTYDGTNVRIYINGVLDSTNASTIGTLAQANTQDLRIGGLGGSFNFTGSADEIGIYNRALTEAEIQSIANAGLGGKVKAQSTVPSNLAAWYAGDGNTNDLQGGNNATLENGATYGNGKVGQGFRFDGFDDQITIPHNANQNGGTNLTLEAWIYSTNLVHGGTIIQKRTAGNVGGYLLEPTQPAGGGAPNGLAFIIMIGGVYQNLNPANIVTANVWQHVAATYDGAFMRIYVNGVEVGNRAQTGAIDNVTTPIVIGRNAVNTTVFSGGIDEIGIYNRALSAAEIRDQFYAGNGGKYKGASNPTVTNTTKTGEATVTFGSITTGGAVQLTPLNAATLPPLPMGSSLGLNFDISTTAVYTNPTVCFNVPTLTPAQFADLRIYHLEARVWQNRTAVGNVYPNLCTSGLTSLSPFAVVFAPTTAANTAISGRVIAGKNSLSNVAVTLSGGNLSQPLTVKTNSFGNYKFDNLPTGATYVLTVSSKRYTFTPSTKMINLNDEVTDADFAADNP
ncbi:MAG TPA: sialidase domain-containing protein, partial [Pyrinomonadaceae bacterium]|nr:sialidase domain-containing protein [Pyrinomonadaceae bacterium]